MEKLMKAIDAALAACPDDPDFLVVSSLLADARAKVQFMVDYPPDEG